ncbi:hypothetical protein [Aestuariicoccus sp. MJ-SS9]|uniref:hypothetical protein n=1 Tax=Aestuariicoccus sp. MJ-SS9 TaxID=3079855 RepID=UPI0029317CF3|nr:hypothetical protein [Aestuariicoccus sp. MJ-SS9]
MTYFTTLAVTLAALAAPPVAAQDARVTRPMTQMDYDRTERLLGTIRLRKEAGDRIAPGDLSAAQKSQVAMTYARINALQAAAGGDEAIECQIWGWGVQCIAWPYFCYIDVSSDGVDAACGNCTDPENGGCD